MARSCRRCDGKWRRQRSVISDQFSRYQKSGVPLKFLLRLAHGGPQCRGHRSCAERSQRAVLDRWRLAVNAHGYVRLTRDVDLVLQLDPSNVSKGMNALFEIGYQMSIPAKPEDFANPEIRERWRHEKRMITLKLWSDEHQRTPVDIFVYEPFDFANEHAIAAALEVCPGLVARVVSLETLLKMKRDAGRPQDLMDIEELQRAR
jgi:hypothetical protein